MSEKTLESLTAELAEKGQTLESITAELNAAKSDLAKANTQVAEKQTLIDEHRPEISSMKEELKELKEKFTEKQGDPLVVNTAETPEQTKAKNDAIIAAMSSDERQELVKSYEGMNSEQKQYLDTSEGMATFLKESVPTSSASKNPFAKPEAKPDPKAQFNALFGVKGLPPVAKTSGAGFQADRLPEIKGADARSKQIADARARLGIFV